MSTDLVAAGIDTDWGQFRLGNETYSLENATFVRNRETPRIYDANHVADVRAETPQEIEALLGVMDREYDYAGHRRFDVDFRTPPEFVARLHLEEGYVREDALVMLLEGELNGSARSCDIRPLESVADWDAMWELMWLDWKESHEKGGRPVQEDVAREMWRAKQVKQPPVQYWLAYADEKPVAFFNSWEGIGGVGQVEDLFTHPDFRKRGIATSLIHHCVADVRAKGAGAVVIVADPSDTPKHIYFRMGFRPLAVVSHYLKRLNT